MNCKQGDIAMVVRHATINPGAAHMVGVVFECEALVYALGMPGWLIKGGPIQCQCCGVAVFGFFDAELQPLRPESKAVPAEAVTSEDARA